MSEGDFFPSFGGFLFAVLEPFICRFTASDGYEWHYRQWHPAGAPRGRIVALHGIQSHSGWYEYSSARLCAAGYEIFFLDRRGSGLNSEQRGHAIHAERLINDVSQFLQHLNASQDSAPGVPTILMGVSWGTKLAMAVAVKHAKEISGLTLLYPALFPKIRASLVRRFVLRCAQLYGIRYRRVPIPLDDPALFTDDPQWREFIRDDPLALHEASVGFLLAGRQLDRIVSTAPAAISCPVLFMLAGRDRIAENVATRRFAEEFPASQRTIIDYPQACHTLEFEPNRDQFIADLLGWLEAVIQLPARPRAE